MLRLAAHRKTDIVVSGDSLTSIFPMPVQSYSMSAFGAGGPEFLGIFVMIAIVVILGAVVLALLRSTTTPGNGQGPDRVPQFYGYTMCAVGLIWSFVSIVSLVDNAQSLSNPAQARPSFEFMEPSISSFESFRLMYDRARRFPGPDGAVTTRDSIPEAELHRRYEALRADRIDAVLAQAHRGIVTNLVSLAIAAGLFLFHWRWVRRTVAGQMEPKGVI